MSASYYLTAMFDNCVPRCQLGSCSMTRTFLTLQRMWLVRLGDLVTLWMISVSNYLDRGVILVPGLFSRGKDSLINPILLLLLAVNNE